MFYFNKKIDLSRFNLFTADLSLYGNGYGDCGFGFSKLNNISNIGDLIKYNLIADYPANTSRENKTIDISDLQGEYYLYIYFDNNGYTLPCTNTYYSFKLS